MLELKKTTNTLNTKCIYSPSTFWFFVSMTSRCCHCTSLMFKTICVCAVNFSFIQQSLNLCNGCTSLVHHQFEYMSREWRQICN
jgi:hypothetical protein